MWFLAIGLAPFASRAAEEAGTPATPPAAVVVIFNRPVAVFRAANFGFNPKERAVYVEKRVTELMAEHPGGEVATRASTEGTAITIGGELAFNITPADVDAIGGQTQEQAAEFAVKALRTVMGDMQKQHSWPFLIKASLFCLAATMVFASVVWLVRRAEHWATPRLTIFFGRMSDRLTKGGFFILAQVAYFVRWSVRIVGWTLVLTGAYTWAAYCLAQFPYTEPWAGNLGGFMTGTFADFLRSGVNALPDLFVVVIIAVVATFLGRLVRGFFRAIQNGQIIFGSLDAQAAKGHRPDCRRRHLAVRRGDDVSVPAGERQPGLPGRERVRGPADLHRGQRRRRPVHGRAGPDVFQGAQVRRICPRG